MAPKPNIQSKKHVARLERERRQTRLIQFVALGVVISVILILVYGYLDVNYFQAQRPVVEVEGEKVTTEEFQARITLQQDQLVNQYFNLLQYQQLVGADVSAQLDQIQQSLETPEILGQQTLDALIDEALIRQEAERRGISVTSEELEKYTRSQFGYFPEGTPTPTITPTQATITYPTLSQEILELVTETPIPTQVTTPTLLPTSTRDPSASPTTTQTPAPTFTASPTPTPYTLEGYQARYATSVANLQDSGYSEAAFKRFLETDMLRTELFEIVTGDTPRIEEQVWARHILVSEEETANIVRERLLNGEDFSTVARAVSEDPGSKEQGGDLGWFGRGQMVPEFEEVAFTLEVGEISPPVESSFGWHIIQVLGHTEVPLSAGEYQQARQTAFREFLATLREEADIKIYDYWQERIPSAPNLNEVLQQ